jgi:predicted nucleic acid-binding protein
MVVVDSSVLVPLLRIGKLGLLKSYFGEVQIPSEVYGEIMAGQIGASLFEEACKDWINISSEKFSKAKSIALKEGISHTDAVLILLAEEKKQILVSNDSALILVAKSREIKCLWLTSIIFECAKKKLLFKKEAKTMLLQLVQAGMYLSNDVYSAMLDEIEKM